MQSTKVDLRALDQTGRIHLVRAMADGHGWHVSTSIDGINFAKHCASWEAVERAVSWVRRHAHETLVHGGCAPAAWRRAAALIGVILLGAGIATAGAQQAPDTPPVTAFLAATANYARVHRHLEQELGPVVITSDASQISRAIQALAVAIRAERAGAKQGDLFTFPLAQELRARMSDALLEHGLTTADLRAGDPDEEFGLPPVTLRVNGTFPWVLGAAMLPCLIEALPPLPPELQYRIVGNDLVLVDVHASLIVDVLPEALAGAAMRNVRPEGTGQ